MLGIEVTPAKAELIEIQAMDVATDARPAKRPTPTPSSATPVLVDDTGLQPPSGWNGLPRVRCHRLVR